MIPKEKSLQGASNVTNLADVRRAKVLANAEKVEHSFHQDDSIAVEATKDPHGNRRFDAVKVARIKAAIAAGEYNIDPKRVADKFIEHDRNQ